MKYFMQTTANKFRKKDLKNDVNFKSVSTYLQSIGFPVVLYNRNNDNELLIKYNLLDFSRTVKGFTVFKKDFKAVFIDEDTSCEEKLYVLLHEVAHIVLGHIDKKNIKDARLMEMEADAFAYQLLYPYTGSALPKALLIFMSLLCLISNLYWASNINTTSATTSDVPIHISEELTEQVFVTPSGTKYHRSDCRYVRGKNCDSLSKAEASKKYTPCSVCRP